MQKIEIKNLSVNIGTKPILKNINLIIKTNEIVAIMGPNGNGKSSLLNTIMGHPKYEIIKGDILIDDKSIKKLTPDKRALLGLFLASQLPLEIPGVNTLDFLKEIIKARTNNNVSLLDLYSTVQNNIKDLKMPVDSIKRAVNEGFSGGEKKKNEILQLEIFNPDFALLDEIDSGLDVDALNTIADKLNKFSKKDNKTLIIVSHYERLFKLIKPTKVYVLINGTITYSGGYEIINKIDQEGYKWLKD